MSRQKWCPPDHLAESISAMIKCYRYNASDIAKFCGVSNDTMRMYIKSQVKDEYIRWRQLSMMGDYDLSYKNMAIRYGDVSAKSLYECEQNRSKVEKMALSDLLSYRVIAKELDLRERAVYHMLTEWGHDLDARKRRMAVKSAEKPRRRQENLSSVREIPDAMRIVWCAKNSGQVHRYAIT